MAISNVFAVETFLKVGEIFSLFPIKKKGSHFALICLKLSVRGTITHCHFEAECHKTVIIELEKVKNLTLFSPLNFPLLLTCRFMIFFLSGEPRRTCQKYSGICKS